MVEKEWGQLDPRGSSLVAFVQVCLFGNKEVNLRDAMRGGASDEELMQIVGLAGK